jgi:molybdopterin molybdotransferase
MNIIATLISVSEAEKIIFNERRDFGFEFVNIEKAIGRTLAKPLLADRDFPPFDRVTMDGIAIKGSTFFEGNRTFKIQATQSAGEPALTLRLDNECIEVMTGAILPQNTDTVIRYEDLLIENGIAKILSEIKQGQNIHVKGEDRKQGKQIVAENSTIRSPEIAIAASIGIVKIAVKKNPKIAIITSGDELVPINTIPKTHQIRASNVYGIAVCLQKFGINATKIHIADELTQTQSAIENALENFDVIILSGGVSMGKKDYIPNALENLGVKKLFHKLAQTPGKPFWFGEKANKIIFALPGNPVSTYLCMIRYVMPWLQKSLNNKAFEPEYAQLSEDFTIRNSNTYFLQVKLANDKAILMATPIKGNGSGDFANLIIADAFLELPAFDRNEFKKGEIFSVWRF